MASSKISIITAAYNAALFIEDAINSVLNQVYENFEYIIIDGGSTDCTMEIVEKYSKNIDYFISEPDKGIYDAWNKGLKKATGEWIMFLGCDDLLLPNALYNYDSFINSTNNRDKLEFISSKVQMIDALGKSVRIKGWRFQWPLFLKEMTVAHPGALHARKLFEKHGTFNQEFRIVGDYELLLRAGENLKAAFMNEVTVVMREEGVSDSTRAIKEHYKAVITTGKHPRNKALINSLVVYLKFKTKKLLQLFGYNYYLRKAQPNEHQP